MLEWVRGMVEEGDFGCAFIGDLGLLRGLEPYPQLLRRTHPRVVVRKTTKEDVAAFCKARGITDGPTINALTLAARRFGGLGDVAEVLLTASDMAGGGTPAPDDIQAALEYLQLDGRGLGK